MFIVSITFDQLVSILGVFPKLSEMRLRDLYVLSGKKTNKQKMHLPMQEMVV